MHEHNEKFNKELENIKETQTTKEYNSKLYDREEWTSGLKEYQKTPKLNIKEEKETLRFEDTLQ